MHADRELIFLYTGREGGIWTSHFAANLLIYLWWKWHSYESLRIVNLYSKETLQKAPLPYLNHPLQILATITFDSIQPPVR